MHLPLSSQLYKTLLLSCLLLPTALPVAPIAAAPARNSINAKIQFTPRRPSAPRSPTTTTGVRGGCSQKTDATVTLFAPKTFVGETSSTHPTFVWFVPDAQSYSIEFRIYQYGADDKQQIVQQATFQSSAGIMQWTLPSDQPGLASGQRYRWQVICLCDPNYPSSALVDDAEFEVVPMPSNLTQTLAMASDPAAKASLYASAGLWYDAIAQTLISPSDPGLKQTRLDLLRSLAEQESRIGSARGETQQKRLIEIINLEQ